MGKFSSEKIKECADWVRENGLIDYGGASAMAFRKAMDISAQTLSRWNQRSEFRDAIEKAKQEFADRLEHELVKSLAKVARGYKYDKKKTEYGERDGKPYIKKQSVETMEVQPNVGAAIFLLSNIAPDRWANKLQTDVNAKVVGRGDYNVKYDMSAIPDDVLFDIADKLQDARAKTLKNEKEGED